MGDKKYTPPIMEKVEGIESNREALTHIISNLMDKYVVASRDADYWKNECMSEYKKFCDLQDEYNKIVNENKQLKAMLDSHTLNIQKINRI